MSEKELSEPRNRKQIRQPVSVPFIWEEKPGIPKKDWKPSTQTVNPAAAPPPLVKFVASVPFKWEEKPGKPLPCFSPPPPEAEIPLPPEKLNALPSPPVNSPENDDDEHGIHGDGVGSKDEQYSIWETDLEACGFETDESFCSVPSLLANRLLSTVVVSNAVPVPGQQQSPSSPASETDSNTSSYAAGTSSLVGASFLECLFPLLSPDSSSLEKVDCPEKSSYTPMKVQSTDFNCKSNSSVAVRRPSTLGELIMMSRRRSYQRKAVQMRRQNLHMDSLKNAVGCCIFGTNNRTGRLQRKWKRQIQLKLM